MQMNANTYAGGSLSNALGAQLLGHGTINAKAEQIARNTPKDLESAKFAAQEFEAVFLTQMMTPVFESLPTDGLMGGGSGEQMYRSLMVQEYGKAMAKAGGVGVADAVLREIIKLQEA